MQQQAQDIGEVRDAIGQLDTHTQQNAALVEETAAAAQHLREQAHALESAASAFRLEAGMYDGHVAQASKVIARAASSSLAPATRPVAAAPAKPAKPVKTPAPAPATADTDDWEQF
jgi:methyl-accepting chemotaxis protein